MISLTIAEISGIVATLTAVAIGISFWFRKWLGDKFASIDSKFDEIEERMMEVKQKQNIADKEVAQMRDNYKNEFVKVREDAHKVKEEIIKEIHKLHISLTAVSSAITNQANFCKMVQDTKHKESK